MLKIGGFIPESYIEWEGRIAACVFTAGCNFKCPYCHSHVLVTNSKQCVLVDPQDVFDYLESHKTFIDGLVVSGGEPTLQDGLLLFLDIVQNKIGVPVLLRTNGTNPEMLKIIFDTCLIDKVSVDYKAPLTQKDMNAVSGVDCDMNAIRRSFSIMANSYVDREYRTTMCPVFIDEDKIKKMAIDLKNDGMWILQQYQYNDVLDISVAGINQFTNTELQNLHEVASKYHKNCVLVS